MLIVLTALTTIVIISLIAGIIYVKRQNKLNTAILTILNTQSDELYEITGKTNVFVDKKGILNN